MREREREMNSQFSVQSVGSIAVMKIVSAFWYGGVCRRLARVPGVGISPFEGEEEREEEEEGE